MSAGDKPTGSCHCGSVVYEIARDVGEAKYCHCQTCQKLTGTAFASVAMVKGDDFKLLQGEDNLVTYESTPGKFRYYCASCFSPMFVKLQASPDDVRIRLGSLNFAPDVTFTGHIWVSEKASWYTINDDLPQAAEF